MATDSPFSARTQTFSHCSSCGQTRPQTAGSRLSLCTTSWILPDASRRLTKAIFPITRLAIMRPATDMSSCTSASASLSKSTNHSCSSAATAPGRKSLGYALPASFKACSFFRRSPISRFSSVVPDWELSCLFFLSSVTCLFHCLQSLLQRGFNELVEGPIQYCLRIAGFNTGSQILNPGLIQYV